MTERTRLEWAEMAHVHHALSASDETVIASHHPLCPFCNPDLLDAQEWREGAINEQVGEGSGSAEARRGGADATGVDEGGEGGRTSARESGTPRRLRSSAVESVAATPTSWAYEPRREYLRRKLTFVPYTAAQLIADGLWTGEFDEQTLPIPSDANPELWHREVWPVYNGAEPTLNKMRSLWDTLITNPECGPRLVSAGLWTGEYDDAGMPIPTPQPLGGRRR